MLLTRKIKNLSEKQTRLVQNVIRGIPPLKTESSFVIIAVLMEVDKNVRIDIASDFGE